jgi:hypothetical protein
VNSHTHTLSLRLVSFSLLFGWVTRVFPASLSPLWSQ